MHEILSAFLLVYAGLFPVVNPLGDAPIFLSMTAGCTEQERNRLAWQVAFNGFWLLLGSMLLGSLILEFFGITVPVVRIAGGLLVAAMGWKLLNGDSNSAEKTPVDPEAGSSLGFYPLTLPLTVGPGSIAIAITIGSHRPHGETAPLLFTALNNQFWSSNLNAPMSSLPVVIFQFALSPYEDWQRLAWTGALIITVAVLSLSILARAVTVKGVER